MSGEGSKNVLKEKTDVNKHLKGYEKSIGNDVLARVVGMPLGFASIAGLPLLIWWLGAGLLAAMTLHHFKNIAGTLLLSAVAQLHASRGARRRREARLAAIVVTAISTSGADADPTVA